MSGLIYSMRESFDQRMTAHKGMLAHLKLDPTSEEAPHIFQELRETMVACGKCKCPNTCIEWTSEGEDGPPPWCHRRSAFLDLLDACEALRTQRGLMVASG